MPRVCYKLLLREKVQCLLEQRYFRFQNYKAVAGSRGQRENLSFITKICGKMDIIFLLKTHTQKLAWLVLLIISSCKSFTSPPGERNKDPVM